MERVPADPHSNSTVARARPNGRSSLATAEHSGHSFESATSTNELSGVFAVQGETYDTRVIPLLFWLLFASLPAAADATHVRGMTISCQTWGQEWATDGFADELAELRLLGVNWVAIHPYAGIRKDGSVRFRAFDVANPPDWITRPIEMAHEAGMSILVIPHLAHWGSGYSHRGGITFETEEHWQRFFTQYTEWISAVARVAKDADAFSVGSELGGTSHREEEWRRIIQAVRDASSTHLVYSANWDEVGRVAFWDAVDCIGVQAYYPISDREQPTDQELARGWKPVLRELRELHQKTGKPVVFTELGYDCSTKAATRPWEGAPRRQSDRSVGLDLQARCLDAALQAIENERSWLRGAFLWKWFVGPANDNFMIDTPRMRSVVRDAWQSTTSTSNPR